MSRFDELRETKGWTPDPRPVAPEEIARRFNRSLPPDYLALLALQASFEGSFGEAYVVFWPPSEVLNPVCPPEDYPGHLLIGGTGGGEFFTINTAGRYCLVPAIGDPEQDALDQGGTLEDLLDRLYTDRCFER